MTIFTEGEGTEEEMKKPMEGTETDADTSTDVDAEEGEDTEADEGTDAEEGTDELTKKATEGSEDMAA